MAAQEPQGFRSTGSGGADRTQTGRHAVSSGRDSKQSRAEIIQAQDGGDASVRWVTRTEEERDSLKPVLVHYRLPRGYSLILGEGVFPVVV